MGSRVRYWQCDGECGALSRSAAMGRDLAAMHIDDPLDDREAKVGRTLASCRFGGQPLEPSEQPAEIFWRKACAFVDDADSGLAVRLVDLHRNLAADRAVFDGIADEVIDNHTDAICVARRGEVRQGRN